MPNDQHPTPDLRSQFFSVAADLGLYDLSPNPIPPATFLRDHNIAVHFENALAPRGHDGKSCPFCDLRDTRNSVELEIKRNTQCRAWLDEAPYNPFNKAITFDRWIVRYGFALAEARSVQDLLSTPWARVFLPLLQEDEKAGLEIQLPKRAREILGSALQLQESITGLGTPGFRTSDQIAMWLAKTIQEDEQLGAHPIAVYRLPLAIWCAEVEKGQWMEAITKSDELKNLIYRIADKLAPDRMPERSEGASSNIYVYRDTNDVFEIGSEENFVRFNKTKGFRHIYHLLQNPRQAIHSSTLQAMADGRMEKGKPIDEIIGEVIEEGWSVDSTAIRDLDRNPLMVANCQQRLKDIETELELDLDDSDPEHRTELREERDQLRQYLSRISHRDGTLREDVGQADRDRRAVQQTIKAARKWLLEKAQGESSFLLPLCGHLDASIITGMFCTYMPVQPLILHLS